MNTQTAVSYTHLDVYKRQDDDKVSIYSFEQDERGCSIPISIPINANGKALKNAEGFFDQINKDLDVILGW